jgi:ketosteroid isomerase-like protein
MKSILPVTILFMVFSLTCIQKALPQTGTEDQIKSILVDMWDAVEKKDIERYAAHLHPDYTSFGEYDIFLNEGRDMEVRNTKKWISNLKSIHTDMHNPKVSVKGNVAWITYYWTDYGEESGQSFSSKGKSTRIFLKENERWLCTHAHFTLIASE